MELYLASDAEAPLAAWDEACPGFNVTPLTERESAVRVQFTKTNVVCVGSHTQCSCGFRSLNLQPGGGHLPPEYAVVEEPEKSAADHAALAAYLRDRLTSEPEIELFACWEGDWAEAAASRSIISPDEVCALDFFFLERGFYRVVLKQG